MSLGGAGNSMSAPSLCSVILSAGECPSEGPRECSCYDAAPGHFG